MHLNLSLETVALLVKRYGTQLESTGQLDLIKSPNFTYYIIKILKLQKSESFYMLRVENGNIENGSLTWLFRVNPCNEEHKNLTFSEIVRHSTRMKNIYSIYLIR